MKNNTWQKGCDMGFTVGQTVYIANTPHTVESIRDVKNDRHPVTLRCNVNNISHYVMIDGRLDECDEIPSVTFKPQPMPDLSKPEWQPKPGELCWVWEECQKFPSVRAYSHTHLDENYFMYGSAYSGTDKWDYFAPFNNGQLPDEFKHLLEGGQK